MNKYSLFFKKAYRGEKKFTPICPFMKKYFIDKFFQQTICIAIFYKPFKTSTSPNAFRNCFFPYPGNSSSIIISS